MADRTDFADFTRLSPSDPLSTDNYGLQDRNVTLLDYYLRLIWTGERDGHEAMADPVLDATATMYDEGGQIPADLSISVGYTLLDSDGGETALSPLAVLQTRAGLASPDDSPFLVHSNLAGTLMANTYSYAVTLTDGLGGETALGPATDIVVPSGQPMNQITVTGMVNMMNAQAAAGWRLWRSIGGEDWHLIADSAAGGAEPLVDDGSLTADCGVNPPSVTGTTRATNSMGVTVPGGQPTEAVSYRIYAAIDGAFDAPSLLGTYDIADVDTEQVIEQLTYLPNVAPETSTTMPAVPGGGGGGASLPGYPETVVLPLYGPNIARQSDESLYAYDPDTGREFRMPYDGGYDRLVIRPEGDYSYNGEAYGPALWHMAEGMKQQAEGSVTVKFQFPEDPASNVYARVGLATSPGRSHLIAEYQAGDMYHYLTISTYDPQEDNGESWSDADDNSDASNFDRPIDINVDLWLRLTVSGLTAKAEIFDTDPAVAGAVPFLSFTGVAKTLNQVRNVVYGGLPSFGWYNGFGYDKLRLYELSATAQNAGAVTPPPAPTVKTNWLDLPLGQYSGGIQWYEEGDFGTLYAGIRPVIEAFGAQYESDVQDFTDDNVLNTDEFTNVNPGGTTIAAGYLRERGDMNQYAAAQWAKAGVVAGDFSWVVKGNRPTAGQQGGMLILRMGDVEAWDIPTGVTMYSHTGPGILIRTGQYPAPTNAEYWLAETAAAVGDVWWVVSRTAGVWRFERWSTDPALGGAPDAYVESLLADAWLTAPVTLKVQGQYWRAIGVGTFLNPAINVLQLDELRLSRQPRKVRLVASAVAEDGAGGLLPAVEADLVSGA